MAATRTRGLHLKNSTHLAVLHVLSRSSSKETNDILARDAEDGEKLAAGIKLAVDKGVLAANVIVEPTARIDVMGK